MKYFISYARRNDRDVMVKIKEELLSKKHQVFTDQEIKDTENNYEMKLEEYIESSDRFMILMSPTSKNAKYVRAELKYADIHEILIEAVLIKGDNKTSIPLSLALNQYSDRRKEFDPNF